MLGRQAEHRRLGIINRRDVCEQSRIVGGRFGASLSLVIGEDKCLVFSDRSANGAAKLILPQQVEAGRGENADGVEFVITKIVVKRTVDVVGAALGDDVYDARIVSAKFRGVVGVDDAKLLDRLLWRRAALGARSG